MYARPRRSAVGGDLVHAEIFGHDLGDPRRARQIRGDEGKSHHSLMPKSSRSLAWRSSPLLSSSRASAWRSTLASTGCSASSSAARGPLPLCCDTSGSRFRISSIGSAPSGEFQPGKKAIAVVVHQGSRRLGEEAACITCQRHLGEDLGEDAVERDEQLPQRQRIGAELRERPRGAIFADLDGARLCELEEGAHHLDLRQAQRRSQLRRARGAALQAIEQRPTDRVERGLAVAGRPDLRMLRRDAGPIMRPFIEPPQAVQEQRLHADGGPALLRRHRMIAKIEGAHRPEEDRLEDQGDLLAQRAGEALAIEQAALHQPLPHAATGGRMGEEPGEIRALQQPHTKRDLAEPLACLRGGCADQLTGSEDEHPLHRAGDHMEQAAAPSLGEHRRHIGEGQPVEIATEGNAPDRRLALAIPAADREEQIGCGARQLEPPGVAAELESGTFVRGDATVALEFSQPLTCCL